MQSTHELRAVGVTTTETELVVRLEDGRILTVPLAWYPKLLLATAEQRGRWRLIANGRGICWEELDEDLSIAGMLSTASIPVLSPVSMRSKSDIDPQLLKAMMTGSVDERLTAMGVLVTAMYEAIMVAPTGEKPEGLAAMSRRESCHRARVGRAARRAGMSIEDFIERNGAVDRVPTVAPSKTPRASSTARSRRKSSRGTRKRKKTHAGAP